MRLSARNKAEVGLVSNDESLAGPRRDAKWCGSRTRSARDGAGPGPAR